MDLIIPAFRPFAFEMTLDARVKCNRLTAPHLVLNRFQRMQAVSLLALGKISEYIRLLHDLRSNYRVDCA